MKTTLLESMPELAPDGGLPTTTCSPSLLCVAAEVRYWEDATVNGVEDEEGDLIPCRADDLWIPVIDINEGRILCWPGDKKASIHYKVCDAGEYWLADVSGKKVAKWKGDYVPDAFLCVGDRGYGDYIIMEVDEDGKIEGWKVPQIKSDEWENLPVNDRTLATQPAPQMPEKHK